MAPDEPSQFAVHFEVSRLEPLNSSENTSVPGELEAVAVGVEVVVVAVALGVAVVAEAVGVVALGVGVAAVVDGVAVGCAAATDEVNVFTGVRLCQTPFAS